jgi:hypothetical protein
VSKQSDTAFRANMTSVRNVSSEEQRAALMQKLEEQAAQLEERLANVGDEFADLSEKDRLSVVAEFRHWAQHIDATRKSLANLTPEIMDVRKAEQQRGEAAAESAKKADDLRKSLGKSVEDLDKTKASDALGALPALEQRVALLREAGAESVAALDAEIAALDAQRQANRLTDEETQRMARLVELRKQLVGVERNITTEREKQAKEAQEKAEKDAKDAADAKDKREHFERDWALDMGKLLAEALGDDKAAQMIEREQRRQGYIDQAKAAGIEPARAEEMASARVDLEDKAKARKAEEEDRATKNLAVHADSSRRVGLGGTAAGYRTDPMTKASQDAAKASGLVARSSNTLAGKIDELIRKMNEKPDRIIMPGVPTFRK